MISNEGLIVRNVNGRRRRPFLSLSLSFWFCVKLGADCAEYNREKKETLYLFREDIVEHRLTRFRYYPLTERVNCRALTTLLPTAWYFFLSTKKNTIHGIRRISYFISRHVRINQVPVLLFGKFQGLFLNRDKILSFIPNDLSKKSFVHLAKELCPLTLLAPNSSLFQEDPNGDMTQRSLRDTLK